jgi:radical SAM superfamily enzyme YgiQ (UPF0313 family)
LRPTRTSRGNFRADWQAERARYLQHERGRPLKPGPVQVEVALGFPNRYAVGMSNLGFQTVYALLNDLDGVRCERTFLWETEGSGTLESGRPLDRFPLVAFSAPFELDYVNLLRMLRQAGIPLLTSRRKEADPIVVMGGPCAFLNPEPMAPFIDLFVVGESEDILPRLVDLFRDAGPRSKIIKQSVGIPGIYVPQYYHFEYLPHGPIGAYTPLPPAPRKIVRQRMSDLNTHATISSIVTPLSHLKNMMLLEVQRGCGYRCRFCAIGQIYHPLRHRSATALRDQVRMAGRLSSRLGLVGSAVADLPGLPEICRQMSDQGLELGLSSLRADRLSATLIEQLAGLGLRTLTVAPEVGSERLRRVIDKSVDAEDLMRVASLASDAGIARLKLYFLVGLPWERQEDLRAIVSLIKKVRGATRLAGVTVSVSPFVPKAATPFQWAPMDEEQLLRRKLQYLAGELRPLKGVSFSGESPRRSVWQGVLALGDRRVGMVLWHHVQKALTWARAWRRVQDDTALVDKAFYIHRERDKREIFPWDVIDHGISREHLWAEFQRARRAAQ